MNGSFPKSSPEAAGMRVKMMEFELYVGSGAVKVRIRRSIYLFPDSRRRTLIFGSSDNREARTQPAVPACSSSNHFLELRGRTNLRPLSQHHTPPAHHGQAPHRPLSVLLWSNPQRVLGALRAASCATERARRDRWQVQRTWGAKEGRTEYEPSHRQPREPWWAKATFRARVVILRRSSHIAYASQALRRL